MEGRKEGQGTKRGTEGKEKKDKKEKNVEKSNPMGKSPIFTGACFDLNVLIKLSQTVFSLYSLTML